MYFEQSSIWYKNKKIKFIINCLLKGADVKLKNKMKRLFLISCILIAFSISASAETSTQLLVNGARIYQDGMRLSPMQVQNIMGSTTEAFRLYERGVRRNRTGNICLGVGGGLLVMGFIPIIIGESFQEWQGPGSHGHSTTSGNMTTAAIGLAGGAVTTAVGFLLRSNGRKDIRDGTIMHNRGQATANVELNLSVTQNGVGLVLNF